MARSVNPYTQEILGEYVSMNPSVIDSKILNTSLAQIAWAKLSLALRLEKVRTIGFQLLRSKQELALLAAREMGKPIAQGIQEVEKCAWTIESLCDQAPEMLADIHISTEASISFVRHAPVGVVLGIMPWNYPFWQAIRYVIPALISGNGVLLKHASNVSGCALALEDLISKSEVEPGIFTSLIARSSAMEQVINHDAVKAVTLTGSESAGAAVAALAGRAIKPTILELGGSNAFVVLEDATIDLAVSDAIIGRFQNSGQSCIAAKRILVQQSVEKEFTEKFAQKVKQLWVGDPTDSQCYIGPMARVDLASELHDQVERSIAVGAKLLVGGRYQGATYSPTILTHVLPGMAVFDEETFGPVAAITSFECIEEMIALVNQSKFGLGVSVYSSDTKAVVDMSAQFEEGSVFVNSIVNSDPRLPFGGTKRSGYGRELGSDGLLSFVNKKTIYVA